MLLLYIIAILCCMDSKTIIILKCLSNNWKHDKQSIL